MSEEHRHRLVHHKKEGVKIVHHHSHDNRHRLVHHKKEEVKIIHHHSHDNRHRLFRDADTTIYVQETRVEYVRAEVRKEVKHHKHLKHVGEFGAVAAGGFALKEAKKGDKREAKKADGKKHHHLF